jgi:hypothetical protein
VTLPNPDFGGSLPNTPNFEPLDRARDSLRRNKIIRKKEEGRRKKEEGRRKKEDMLGSTLVRLWETEHDRGTDALLPYSL